MSEIGENFDGYKHSLIDKNVAYFILERCVLNLQFNLYIIHFLFIFYLYYFWEQLKGESRYERTLIRNKQTIVHKFKLSQDSKKWKPVSKNL